MRSIYEDNPLLSRYNYYVNSILTILTPREVGRLRNISGCGPMIENQLEEIRTASSYNLLIPQMIIFKQLIKNCSHAFTIERYNMIVNNIEEFIRILEASRYAQGGKRKRSRRRNYLSKKNTY